MSEKGSWRLAGWHRIVLVIAFVMRFGHATTLNYEQSFGGWDGREYHAYAQSLLAGNGDDYPRFFNCTRAPGYPLFLVPFVAITPDSVRHIQFVQALLGCAQVWVLALIASHWAGRRAGDWAFVLAAFNPFLIYFCAFVLTECVFITLLWTGMLLLQRLALDEGHCTWPPVMWGGVAIGAACLVRPALQPFLVVAVFWIGWRVLKLLDWRAAFVRMTAFTVVTSALMLPWMLYNRSAHGEFTLSPRGAALVFAQSNSMDYLKTYEAGTKDEYYASLNHLHGRFALEGGEPPEQWAREAREFREQHRAGWWRLQGYKAIHFWTPWLNPLIFPKLQFFASLLTLTPLFLLAAWEILRRIRRPDPYLVLTLGLVAVGWIVGGILFHVQVRYRIPFVDVTFLLLGAVFLGRFNRPATPAANPTTEGARG